MHRTVSIVLAHLNCHMHIVFVVVVFTLVGELALGSNLPVCVASSWLLLTVTIITAYPITSDDLAPR